MPEPVYQIDGARFPTLPAFCEGGRVLIRAADGGRNLHAFNDILRGGLGGGRGVTVFDRLVGIVACHGKGGREEADGVGLILA
jgi:hypothetical protein